VEYLKNDYYVIKIIKQHWMIQPARYSMRSVEIAFPPTYDCHREEKTGGCSPQYYPSRYFTLSVHVYNTPGETCQRLRGVKQFQERKKKQNSVTQQ
jgi:hypothetical protein